MNWPVIGRRCLESSVKTWRVHAMPSKMTIPDVRQLKDEKLPEAEFPGGREQAFRVFFEPSAHDGVWQHAQADTSVEICGVLVGGWGRDHAGPFVNISA